MESSTSPSPPRTCSYRVTVRRNPPRKARATPSTSIAAAYSSLPQNRRDIAPLRLQEILDEVVLPVPPIEVAPPVPVEEVVVSENLRVFLRIRPLDVGKPTFKNGKNGNRPRVKGISPKKETTTKNDNAMKKKKKMEKSEICLVVKDCRSVMLLPPASLQDSKRMKTQVYDGFNHVFASGSLQEEVYEKVMEPLVSDFLLGKSGMLAAMGSSGSGKTHTIFGCPREPGIVPLTLRQLFHHINRNCSDFSRSYYISMFEISSERGKGEKIFDLTSDGTDLCLQQSAIKGLQEILVSDVTEAECVIARGMLKRATAMTNANSQSSRSQCIINIRSVLKKIDDEKAEVWSKNAVLTIVDIAGAERERRTGNQGARLLESNFINNTSMVFGLCLRSLLEHQKNPKKPLQKHFQNSLLTRYLRDYLEGKKRMALILTAKPGEDDYLDTTYLLRQASPFMKIKFNGVEEPSHLLGQKRHIQTLPTIEQPKRKKFRDRDASLIDEGVGAGDVHSVLQEEVILQLQEPEPCKVSGSSPRQLKIKCNGCKFLKEEYCIKLAERDRHDRITQNFSKALWDVLKEYKKKLEVSENEVHNLKENLQKEKFRSSELQEELKELKHRELKNIYEVHAETSAPKSEISECSCTSNLCDAVLCKSQEMSLQIHAEFCAPKPGVSEISSPSNLHHDVLCENQEMPLQVRAEACAPKLEIPECNNTSNIYDGVVCKSPEMSPQVHVEAFAPKPEVLECIRCDATVCKSPEMSLQVHAETCALNLDVPECGNTPSLCDAFVCESPEMSLLVHAPKPEVPECSNASNLCGDDVHAEASAPPKSEISECSSTSNLCDVVLCKSPEMSLQEYCAPKLGVSEIISTLNLCHDVLCKNQEMSLQVHAEACAPKPEIPQCNNASNLYDAVVCKSPDMSPQVHVEAFAPKPEVLECTSTSLCDATVCKSPEMSLQVHAETCALNLDVPECSNTPSFCDAFVCKSLEMSLLVHAPKPEVPECSNTSNLCNDDVPKNEAKNWFSNTPSSVEKPRRRLGPAPSLLLKDISNLDLKDDNNPKGKGNRGGRKSMTRGRALTQGSISLLKLLGNYHHL